MTDSRSLLARQSATALGVSLVVAALLATTSTASAQAPSLSRTKYTNGAAVRRVFGEVVTDANEWTVRIKGGDVLVAYGTIVRGDGYIVSKASQLHGDLVVRLADGRELPATYVGYSANHDVALLKVDADALTPVVWEEGDDPAVGGWVVTPDQQGAPGSVGVVSVARRAIPRVHEPALLGIEMKVRETPVVIQRVFEGSAAEQAGLQADDVIHQVDDVLVNSPDGMKHEISRRSPGDTITLQVERGDQRLTLRATLTHPFGEFQSRIAMQNHMGGELSERRTGFPIVLQHDSVLSPEECGGPLVDLSGRAIGINIARAGRTESYAIPDDVLRPLIDDLLSGHYPPPEEAQPTFAADTAEDTPPTPPQTGTSR